MGKYNMITELRDAKGEKQEVTAEAVGLNRGQLSTIEAGADCKLSQARRIANHFGKSIDYVFSDIRQVLDYEQKVLFVQLYSGDFVKRNSKANCNEMFNLTQVYDKFYGIALCAGSPKDLNLQSLGGSKDDDYVEGVTVVYFEDVGDVKKIVGFITNAVVFRKAVVDSFLNRKWFNLQDNKWEEAPYNIVSMAEDTYCVDNEGLEVYDYALKYPTLTKAFRAHRYFVDNYIAESGVKGEEAEAFKTEVIDLLNLSISRRRI